MWPAHIKTWSIAINGGTAMLDMAPAILVKSLMPAKQSLSNPMRDPYPKSSNSGSTPTPSSGTAIHVPTPMPAPQIIYQMMPHGYQHSYGLPASYQGTPEPPPPHHDVRSSSVVSGPDGLERLASYIHWLVRKNPRTQIKRFKKAEAKGHM